MTPQQIWASSETVSVTSLRRRLWSTTSAEAWSRAATLDGEATDLYGLALSIVQRDADHLKTLAYRLHQADLRPPKPGDDLPRRPEAWR